MTSVEETDDNDVVLPWQPHLRSPGGAATAVVLSSVFVTAVVLAGTYSGIWTLAAQVVFAVALGPLVVTDVAVHRLPDVFVLTALGINVLLVGGAWLSGEITTSALWGAYGSGLGLFAAMYLVALLTGGMGFGDVKLASLIGVTLGVVHPAVAAFGVFVFPALAAVPVVMTLLALKNGRKGVPFGPMLAVGSVVSLILSTWVIANIQTLF